jgi:hypothetical protein
VYFNNDWALVVPMANEEADFAPFATLLGQVLEKLDSGRVYFVVTRFPGTIRCSSARRFRRKIPGS